jgi:hypothetical protein
MWVKVKLEWEVWVFVSAYGPGSEKGEEERVKFWLEVSECVNGFGANAYVVLLGDLNARVGNGMIEKVIGKYGVPGLNDSGERLLEICLAN